MKIGDIKEEEENGEDDEYTHKIKEIKSLRMLPEELDTYEAKSKQFVEIQKQIEEKQNKCLENDGLKQQTREETKKIHNNLRYFLSHELESSEKQQKTTENDYLLNSLAFTNNSKPIQNSANFTKEDFFINENFKKDFMSNDDSYEETKEKYAKIFTDDDYSDHDEILKK